MKCKTFVLLATATILSFIFFGCMKDSPENIVPIITDDNVEISSTFAMFSWKVKWVGKRVSVVELSEHEDMSDSKYFGSEEEYDKDEFIAVVKDLKPVTKYYYRYLVWNCNYENNKFVFEENSIITDVVGTFSVSETKQVFFSKGNLQCIASSSPNYYRFAENQWDYMGKDQNFDGVGPDCDYPKDTIDHDFFYQWPEFINHGITNDENNNSWRNLSKEEWDYLFYQRATISGIRFVFGKVNNANGVILLPDNWTNYLFSLNDVNGGGYFSNTIDSITWNGVFEINGAVFLPAAGTSNSFPPISRYLNSVGIVGCYASYSHDGSYYYFMQFGKDDVPNIGKCLDYWGEHPYDQQCAMRLVRDKN